jgi:putative transposase
MEDENLPTNEPKESKCRKRWIFPTASQKKTIKLWLDGARFAYNLGVDVVNKTHRWGRKKVRECAAVQNGKWEEKAPEHLWKVPYKIRDSALLDVSKACAALKAKEKSVHRKLKYRSSSDRRQSVAIEMRWANGKTSRSLWASVFGTTNNRKVLKMESGKHLPHIFKHDFRLGYERMTKRYYVAIPTDVRVLPQKSSKGGIVAIDPGVRTFATCYDPKARMVTMFGNIGGRKDGTHQGTELLGWLARKSDRLTAKAKKAHGRHRYRIKKVAARIRQRISDLVDDFHHKLAIHLCETYSVILLPKFSTKSILSRKQAKKKRVVNRRTARKLMQMAPYSFWQYLIHKAREFGTRVVVCDEYWTSKTCGQCGRLKHNLGGNKTYVCPKHRNSHVFDRDANAARNIILRYVAMNKLHI